MPNKNIIQVNHLSVKYRDIVAVDDVSFEVRENEIFGMIGPNGAGKTSLVEAIEGLRDTSSGEISILEMNPKADRIQLYNEIGVQLQQTSYPDQAKVEDICKLFSSFYDNPAPYDRLLSDMRLDRRRKTYKIGRAHI